ncbi:MAG: DUF2889 domain-containing protein [Deltaproteobacteria bacterium]|nr:DUF2889 domain-containing protein [Deltaproteobacteria bacterium]
MADLRRFKNEPVHTRDIHITTYRIDDTRVMVEGVLTDNRKTETYHMTTGEMQPPGVVHDLIIRLLLGADLKIEDIEIDMNHVPRTKCRETSQSLKPLVGHRIAPGFTQWVKETFGGPKGCTHLNALLLAMASASVQGFWANRVGRKISLGDAISQIKDPAYLIDTCWLWRKDGPLAREFEEALDHQFHNHDSQ